MIDYRKEGIVHYNNEVKNKVSDSIINNLKKEDLELLKNELYKMKRNEYNTNFDKIFDILMNKTNFYEKLLMTVMSLPDIGNNPISFIMGLTSLGILSKDMLKVLLLDMINIKNEKRLDCENIELVLNNLTVNELYKLRNMINNEKGTYIKK